MTIESICQTIPGAFPLDLPYELHSRKVRETLNTDYMFHTFCFVRELAGFKHIHQIPLFILQQDHPYRLGVM